MRGADMSDCWIPNLEFYDDFDGEYPEYFDFLYEIFKSDFIDSNPKFENKNVVIRKHPIQLGKEEAFFHVTCKDFQHNGDRDPDFRRCERIRWVRAFIENYNCDSSKCPECDGVKVWEEEYKSRTRVHLLLEEERYMVVVEKRESYVLLITAFYFDYDNALERNLKKWEKFHK